MGVSQNRNPVVMALALDKARSCEQIVIREEYQVRRYLEGSADFDALYNEERPLGEFRFSHEKQIGLKSGSWVLPDPLSKSYGTGRRIIPWTRCWSAWSNIPASMVEKQMPRPGSGIPGDGGIFQC